MTTQENNDNRHRPNVPPLRFRGFTDPWQRKRLGEITRVVKRKNTDLVTSRPLTISAQYGMIDQTEFFSKVIASDDLRTYYLIERGEFAYNRSYSQDYPWGTIKRLDKYDSGALSTLYTCFALKGIESEFMVHYFETTKWYKQIQMIAAEGARNHGLLNIPSSDFFDTYHILPSSLAEQEKIGTFFQALDELIAAREEELEKLRQMKAALLDAMFPSDAPVERVTSATAHTLYDSLLDHTLQAWDIVPTETSTPHTPRLRFRGFTDPWQRMRLGDLAVVSRGLTYNPSNVRHQGVRVLRSSNIAGEAFVISEEDVFVVRNCVNVDYARNGDILITAANGSAQLVGKHCIVDNIVDESVVAGGFMFLLRSSQPHFLNASMSSSWYTRFISITSMGGGGSINNLRKNELEELYLPIPSLAEQKQIGAFFRSQDEGIATATEQIDKLKRIKQACLKQMFV